MNDRLKRLRYRASHRGTREADALVGGFFDRFAGGWDDSQIAWFEALVEQDDADIMAWALGVADPPAALARGDMVAALRRLDYVPLP